MYELICYRNFLFILKIVFFLLKTLRARVKSRWKMAPAITPASVFNIQKFYDKLVKSFVN